MVNFWMCPFESHTTPSTLQQFIFNGNFIKLLKILHSNVNTYSSLLISLISISVWDCNISLISSFVHNLYGFRCKLQVSG